MKRIGILILMAVLGTVELGCGGPAIGDLKTITLTASPSTNLVGEGGTVQLSAMGVYSSGTQKDISTRVTYTVTPVGTDDAGVALPKPVTASCGAAQGCGDVTVNSTGLATAVAPFVCT